LPRERGTARLKEAVAAYREALRERTREYMPLQWAMTQKRVGYVHFCQCDFVAAALDLEEIVGGPDAYPIVWLHLARARAGEQDAKERLKQNVAELDRAK
jgi:hypothetical protein